jgi:hypothetical protein
VYVPKPATELRSAGRHWALAIVALLVGFIAIDSVFAGSRGAPIGAYTTRGAYSFNSLPALHPPKLALTSSSAPASLAPGYIFTTSFYDLNEPPMVGQSGPLMLDNRLQPVWFEPLPESVVAANLSLQTYEGKPALAWWQGVITNTGATESGEDVVVNQHYQTVARLRGADGWKITLHALVIDGEDAWVTANKDIPKDLSGYGGAYNGTMTDAAVQEYNLKSGKLLYTWDALHHVPLSQSYATVPTNGFPWDAYHVNAIDPVGNGSLLVSLRNTWAAYLVNVATGRTEWTLGGRQSSFSFGPGAEFQWQHDATLGPGSTVTLFDDHCCLLTGGGSSVPATAPSRGLVLRLDQATHAATRVAQYSEGAGGAKFESEYMGSTQPLANSNVLVGWGSERWFSEYAQGGKLLLEGEFPAPDQGYRATLNAWVGLPLSPPAGAARERDGRTTVYASWNGATRVASWRVLAETGAKRPAVLASAARSGFETAIPVPAGYRRFTLQALDAQGRVIGASEPFETTA